MDATSVFPLLEVESADLRRAGEVQRLLAGAALRGRKVPDLVIAAVAERAGLTVLHYDRDFELIGQVTGQRHQWILPPERSTDRTRSNFSERTSRGQDLATDQILDLSTLGEESGSALGVQVAALRALHLDPSSTP